MGKVGVKDSWLGPAKVLAINNRLVIIQYGSVCSIIHDTRVRPYYPTTEVYKPPPVEPIVDFSKIPKQQRGRHLVQNQGGLVLEGIRENLEPLSVVDMPREDPVPEVREPFSGIFVPEGNYLCFFFPTICSEHLSYDSKEIVRLRDLEGLSTPIR